MVENFLIGRSDGYSFQTTGKLVGDDRIAGRQPDGVRRGAG